MESFFGTLKAEFSTSTSSTASNNCRPESGSTSVTTTTNASG
ncbi:transposase, IS3 family domain protein [Burkholderia pseudomallei]|nr:transposase, IS3 family domain protein [Burkholderia pseudomallei]